MTTNIVALPDPLDRIKKRIRDGFERTKNGRQEWIEGTLDVAAALHEGRQKFSDHIRFGDWLKKNGIDFFNKNDRAALLRFAENADVARTVLTETTRMSLQMVWRDNKSRFPNVRKTTATTTKRQRVTREMTMTLRVMKLGAETIAKIQGTSLDRADEMRELIMLNRGAAPGELTPIVRQLVDDAAAGKLVSARGETAARFGIRAKDPLLAAWTKRMVYAWTIATHDERQKFIEWLMEQLGREPQND